MTIAVMIHRACNSLVFRSFLGATLNRLLIVSILHTVGATFKLFDRMLSQQLPSSLTFEQNLHQKPQMKA
jgi:hypothetical protein